MTGKAEQRIKILHVIDSLGIGGAERVVISVVNGLDPQVFEQIVCCVSGKGRSAHLLAAHARCIDMGKGSGADHLMPLKIARVIRKEEPQVVHTQSWAGVDGIIAQLIARGPRVVHSEHGRNLPDVDGEPMRRRLMRRCAYHLVDLVFTISEEMRQFLCRQTGFPARRMRVIPNGVDIAKFDSANGRGLREELGLSPDDCVIGTVARFDPVKDLASLIRAFAHLCHHHKGKRLKLLLVGDGSERPALEKLASDIGIRDRMVLTGFNEDIPRLLRAMDIFALSSVSEGLPIAVLEAMCARLPVVATNVGALPELVTGGVSGLLVEPRAPQQLAEKLAILVNDPELSRSFGASGRCKIEQNYSLDLMLRRYTDLYLSLSNSYT
jgi:sugar transferase (PEP-CTERM/EpsH1 system associated)